MTEGLAEPENPSKWPTPATRDHKGANSADHLENGTGRLHLDQLPNFVAHLWPTPRTITGGAESAERKQELGRTESGGGDLQSAALTWSTPSVADVTGGRTSRSGDRKDELLLNSQAKLISDSLAPYARENIWPTPTSLNRPRTPETLEKCAAYRMAKAGQTTVPLYLEEVALASSPLAPQTSPDGPPPSPERRSLNPLFVEWLMGWPHGWTLIASTDFGCSATGLSRFKARMRSALSQFASLPAPPAQLSLFG